MRINVPEWLREDPAKTSQLQADRDRLRDEADRSRVVSELRRLLDIVSQAPGPTMSSDLSLQFDREAYYKQDQQETTGE